MSQTLIFNSVSVVGYVLALILEHFGLVPIGTAKDIALFLGGGAVFSGGMALKKPTIANVASTVSASQATAEQG